MTEHEEGVLTPDEVQDMVKSAATEAILEYDANKEAQRKAEEEAERAREEERKAIREELLEELQEEGQFVPARKGGFNVASKYKLGPSDKGEFRRATGLALWKYVRHGDTKPWRGLGHKMETWGSMQDDIFDPGQFGDAAIKAAFEEGTASEGGVLVPNDFFPDIVEKRDQVSWPRRAGVSTFQTNRDVVDVPAENASQGTFAITAEEGAYDTDAGPTLQNIQITVHKFTRTHRISEELEADEAAGLPQFISSSLGRAWGLTENQYVAIGTGSSQPEGVMVGADTDDILTLDSGSTMTTDEIPELFYKLQQQYRSGDEAIWLMNESTEAVLVGRLSSNKPELGEPLVNMTRAPEDGGVGRLMGYRVFNDSNVGAVTTGGNFAVLFGNMSYYMLAERQGLVITRNPFLYEATGQIGIFARARWGGAVTQDEAFKVAKSLA